MMSVNWRSGQREDKSREWEEMWPTKKVSSSSGPVAQWITRQPTELKIAGSIPARVGKYFSTK
jgi:hypothetical protein